MKKTEIAKEFKEKANDFVFYVNTLSDQDFEKVINDKWSPGQQLEHIYLSTKPIEQVFLLPKFLLNIFFGKPKQTSKSYNEVVTDYQKILDNGGTAPSKFIPKQTGIDKKERLIKQLSKTVDKLIDKLNQKSEEDLDTILIPHPLLGRITLRELYYFTIYHILHHRKKTEENLTKSQ